MRKRRVTIAEGSAVYAHGEQHPGGGSVERVPDSAAHWISRGWAAEATDNGAAPAKFTPVRTSQFGAD